MTISTVVIPAAGLGTRVKSLTKNTCKEMLPYQGLPLIEHSIMEALRASFQQIIVITNEKKLSLNQFISQYSNIKLVNQLEPKGLGHAILQSEPLIKDEFFAVLLPDVVLPPKGIFNKLLERQHALKTPVLGVTPVPKELVSYSGIVAPIRKGKDWGFISNIKEKPDESEAPSNLAIIGRYVLDRGICDRIRHNAVIFPGPKHGEVQLTNYIRSDSAYYLYEGKFFDGGNSKNYEAN